MSQPLPDILALGPAQVSSVLLNHVGFNTKSPKKFLVAAPAAAGLTSFELLGPDGAKVFTGPLVAAGTTDEWSVGHHWLGDLSGFEAAPGLSYRIRVPSGDSTPELLSERFDIGDELLAESIVPDLIHYFRSQRVAGKFAKADHTVPFAPAADGTQRSGTVDVHGGWYDASGDVSKYLSHLSYANFMNPQQTPLVAWNLLDAADVFATLPDNDRLTAQVAHLREEAIYGADFLVRMQDPEGYFYMTVFDKWSKDIKQREICSYATQKGLKFDTWQAGYRQGGGLTIAALARTSTLKPEFIAACGDYAPEKYLAAAETGFQHLELHNKEYLDNGEENIIDDYCALLAASELFLATRKEEYLEAARRRAQSLQSRQASNETVKNFWVANNQLDGGEGFRPFFHASDAGLPVTALDRYIDAETDEAAKDAARATIRRAVEFELAITTEVNNPFHYPRQYVKPVDAAAHTAFFFPHNNESGYWWQGENARLGSLSAALSKALKHLTDADSSLAQELRVSATRHIDWILGANPFDMCMLQGRGRRNPEYLRPFANAPGGVCNGITSGFDNEHDITFKPEPHGGDWAQNWRWGEQWIPHGANLLLAVAYLGRY
ncbi:glucosamine-link cellobiase [Polychytrium aggregatum]|uniref:glucosamine-link cellobiase n=1 Tax=Polychytrium aggregatum TaxID=110093 RepID=UPI0022FDB2B9|nr:glucosamine-link cellobiase [Polychytrium aggregatum]KAI9205139.1 glucosamine-link cellobiase [Polychytrium aggregatum]